jgi:hypothetical protein
MPPQGAIILPATTQGWLAGRDAVEERDEHDVPLATAAHRWIRRKRDRKGKG